MFALSDCESGTNNYDNETLSSEIPQSDEIADAAISTDDCILLSDNVFVGTSEGMDDGGGDELAWYFNIWGFGASGISIHYINIVGIDIFNDWTRQFVGHGNHGWRNRREANFITFINDFGITKQDLIDAQEATFDMSMNEIEALIYWGRYGEHTDAHERAEASFWASLVHSLSDFEALVSNNVSAIWAAFPGYGIYQNGRAYSPEWVLTNMWAAVLQEQLPEDEIMRIFELASHYPCLDIIRQEAEITFYTAMARLPLIIAIAEAQSLNHRNYTVDSWADLQRELRAAMIVYENLLATQNQVDVATAALQEAINALVPFVPPIAVDRHAFYIVLGDALSRERYIYTPQSWAILQNAINVAIGVRDNENATQEQVDMAMNLLLSAISALQRLEAEPYPSPGPAGPILVESIVVDDLITALPAGKTVQLTTTIWPPTATNSNVIWVSWDENIATVDETGLVRALSPGTAYISVTSEDGNAETHMFILIIRPDLPPLIEPDTPFPPAPRFPPEIISVTGIEMVIVVGNTLQLSAVVSPSIATVTWISWDEDIATISETGLITAISPGVVGIDVTAYYGGLVSDGIALMIIVSPPGVLLGDVNGDGVVDYNDLIMLNEYLAGYITSLPNPRAADIDSNGEIDDVDVLLLQMLIQSLY